MTLRERAGSYEGRLILGVIGLFVVVPVLGLALGLRVSRGFDGYTAGIYVGTGMAVLWYTIETYYLRRAMVRANEIAVLPLVIARFEQVPVPGVAVGGTWAWKVVLRNIGKSAALRVEVEEFNVEDTALGKEVWRIEGIDVIEGGQSVAVESSAYLANTGERLADSLVPLLETTAQTHRVRILYEDVAGGIHESVMQMGKGGIRLVPHS